MKVSSRGEYALRALLVLGQQQGKVCPINEIAKQTLVTVKYLEQILLQLRKLGYVHSKRGIQGGYMLRLSPTDINIEEVIRQIEGPLSPMGCASTTAYVEDKCLLKPLWTVVRDTIARVLEKTTLDDLLNKRITTGMGGESFVKNEN